MYGRSISRLFAEEETTDICYELEPLIITIRISNRIPMYEGQSNGFGTSAGDQQYVNGTSKSSVKLGPAAVGIGSKSSVFFLQPLIISDNLKSSTFGQRLKVSCRQNTYPCQVIVSIIP